MRTLFPTRTVHRAAAPRRARRHRVSPVQLDQGAVLVESRTLTGDPRHLPVLVAALRALAEDHSGHLGEVHFSDEGTAVRVVNRWRSAADLRSFVERAHDDLLVHRAATGRFPEVERALWWSCSATVITPEQVGARTAHLRAHGPGPRAFTLGSPVPAPEPDPRV
ncbi:uncharacterized protein DUF3291 [Nocardiopsis sp. L17-MgMaSL7]|nr:uncharacterized protein DUF3291 [Nocardiopsis sp. L17-MgMaSL7]